MSTNIQVIGNEEAIRSLMALDDKMQKRAIVKALKASAKPTLTRARQLARPSSKRVARSIKAWEARKVTFPLVLVAPKYTKNANTDPWFAHMIEGGTKGIKRSAGAKRLPLSTDHKLIHIRSLLKNSKNGFGYRKDQPAKPFMQPAYDQTKEAVNNNITKELSSLIDKGLKK